MEKLKICIITDSLFTSGGVATAARELSYQLALAGHEVRVISGKGESSDPKDCSESIISGSKGVLWHYWIFSKLLSELQKKFKI